MMRLCAGQTDPAQLSTACFAILELNKAHKIKRITVANAGHPLAILSSNGSPPTPLGIPGDMLGAFEAPSFQDFTRELSAHDAVVFYTDGLTDARIGRKAFGAERLTKIVQHNNGGGASGLVAKIRETLSRADVRQKDDVAIVAIQVQAAQASAS